MGLPPALLPLRNPVFARLWFAYIVTSLGTWFQNTGAGWLMTTLAPSPLVVSLVQAATILPFFLLALPAGAVADIVDRRLFLIGTQVWTMAAAGVLAGMTIAGLTGPASLLILTFAIGMGSAMTGPAWGAIVPDLVPREDLVQAIALNGIGFNIARALGPAFAGFLVVLAGSGFAFALFAVSILAVIAALASWRRPQNRRWLPREHLAGAMRAGIRFVANTPGMRATMVRSFAYSLPAAAPWAILPLIVRQQLQLGAGMYGLILGLMGAGGVASGLLLPNFRHYASRSTIVFVSSLCSCVGMAMLGLAHHWTVAALGMAVFGIGWVAAFSTLQAAAQLICPPWVRARALSIYQLSYNGALAFGSFGWGWLALHIGLSGVMFTAAAGGAALAVAVRVFRIDQAAANLPSQDRPQPRPEAAAAELVPILPHARGHVMETMHYRVPAEEREAFLEAMAEVRRVRGRAGAMFWQLYENVAHPEGWLETWTMENWVDHLREAARLSDEDQAVLARASRFQRDPGTPAPSRYLAVEPTLQVRLSRHAG
ncbi:MAG: MFS transporter [Proteobacteria bacterium]|nr:MFS transporter [Pseudomonadota bacterium]